MELDPWQKEVLDTESNICLRSGRQVGKSTIIGLKAAMYALENPKKLIMVISKTERQAGLLFAKILGNIHIIDKIQIKKGKDRPTKHIIKLKNGSVIHCLPAGDTGFGIMGFTIDLLIADEAAFIPEEVWNSIVPALAVTRGSIWLLSTPFLSEGYYYNCFHDPAFTSFHQSAEDCPRKDQEFLDRQREKLTKAQYAQMYLGEFVTDFKRIFSEEWIAKVCILEEKTTPPKDEAVLGVDIAAMGDDESAFSGLVWKDNKLKQFHFETTAKTETPDTEDKIKHLDKYYDFWKIGIDDGGIGAAVLSHLLRDDDVKRKVIGLNNAKRVIDADDTKKTLYKEAMYMNLLAMGERGQLQLFKDDKIIASLRSVLVEENGKVGARYNHPVESLIRAAYLLKEKPLNPMVYSIKV